MDSATTDVCEWCKKPMLATGTSVNGKQASSEAASVQPQHATAQAVQTAPPVAGQESDGLVQLGAATQVDAQVPEPGPTEVLRPLGGPSDKPAAGPSHGLSEDATRTSVNVASYLGPDNSLFRPIARTEHSATAKGMDPLAHRGTRRQEKSVSDVPDNIRLMRSLRSGLAISFPLAIAQFVLTHKVPEKMFVVPLIRGGDSFVAAIVYGLASGVFLGFGLGALLVQFKKGPFIGLILGLILGNFALATEPAYWGMVAAGLTGILVGRAATFGYRRVVSL
jgi:hypothetical protein